MRKIYGIGETVFDIIFKDGSPQAAKPGGSVLNAMVSLGRTGLPVSFISEYGSDDVGSLIDKFLNDNGVNTSYAYRYDDANTSLALAFLNEKNDARYTFYKDFPEKRLNIEFPDAGKEDIVMCGSFYAVWAEIRPQFMGFIKSAEANGALILYDPNFRKSHVSEIDKLKPLIVENMKMAGIVRGSDEDFRNMFGAGNADEAWDFVKNHCNCLVYTASGEGVFVRTKSFSGRFPVKKINPVSTIGAGDNFNAGMMAAIYNNGITRDELAAMGEEKWKKVISTGVEFATEVCLSYENYIGFAFASRYFSASSDHI
ncbi:MAG: PfkB family carbohydrate kinase [Bacteroidia bacterium]|nr:PfkB family carbohydrate kinase [Bacteroidia bacterium]